MVIAYLGVILTFPVLFGLGILQFSLIGHRPAVWLAFAVSNIRLLVVYSPFIFVDR